MIVNLADIESSCEVLFRLGLGFFALIHLIKLFLLILGLFDFLLCQGYQFFDARLFHSELLGSLIRFLVAVLSLLPLEFNDNRLQLILQLLDEQLICLIGLRVLAFHHLLLRKDLLHALCLPFERVLKQLDAILDKLDETSSIAAYIGSNSPYSLLQRVLVLAQFIDYDICVSGTLILLAQIVRLADPDPSDLCQVLFSFFEEFIHVSPIIVFFKAISFAT